MHLIKFIREVKVYKDLNKFNIKKPILTIGTFDGLHLGHRKVLNDLKAIAKDAGGESVVFTFYPHPRIITSPNEQNLRLITTLEEKIELFKQLNIDHLIVYPFDYQFSQLSYQDFVKQVLIDKIRLHTLVIGYDHRFGKERKGDFESLLKIANKNNFEICILDALKVDELNVSSTKIRQALQDGNIRLANKMLGHRFTLHGKVVEGNKVGRTIGFPTANIESSDKNKIIPRYGVYAVKIRVGNQLFNGMLNVGTRPTFNKNADNRSVEVNIFDFNQDIYHQKVELIFFDRTRDEKKFKSAEELKQQLTQDEKQIRAIFAH